jgi:hypothetical protein
MTMLLLERFSIEAPHHRFCLWVRITPTPTRRDFGKEIAGNHLAYIAPEPVGRADEHFDSDRSGLLEPSARCRRRRRAAAGGSKHARPRRGSTMWTGSVDHAPRRSIDASDGAGSLPGLRDVDGEKAAVP